MEQLNRFLGFDATLIPIDSAGGSERYRDGLGPGGAGSFFIAGQDLGLMMMPNVITSAINGMSHGASGWHLMMPQWFEDALVAQSVEADPAKRIELLRKMQRYLIEVDPGPLLTLYQQSNSVTWNKNLKNFNVPPNHYANMEWEHVWLEE